MSNARTAAAQLESAREKEGSAKAQVLVAVKDGSGVMTDFVYRDGAKYLPSDAEVAKMRPHKSYVPGGMPIGETEWLEDDWMDQPL